MRDPSPADNGMALRAQLDPAGIYRGASWERLYLSALAGDRCRLAEACRKALQTGQSDRLAKVLTPETLTGTFAAATFEEGHGQTQLSALHPLQIRWRLFELVCTHSQMSEDQFRRGLRESLLAFGKAWGFEEDAPPDHDQAPGTPAVWSRLPRDSREERAIDRLAGEFGRLYPPLLHVAELLCWLIGDHELPTATEYSSPVLLVDPLVSAGAALCHLQLYRLERGCGAVFPHPLMNAYLQTGPRFQRTLQHAIKQEISPHRLGIDVMWNLLPISTDRKSETHTFPWEALEHGVEGPSAGATFACSLRAIREGQPLDPSVAMTAGFACLEPGREHRPAGWLARVADVEDKLLAAALMPGLQRKRILKVLVAKDQSLLGGKSQRKFDGTQTSGQAVTLQGVATVDEAYHEASAEVQTQRRLIRDYMSEVKRHAARVSEVTFGDRPLPQVRMRVRVRTDRFKYDEREARRREQERVSRGQHVEDDGRAYSYRQGLDREDQAEQTEILDWDLQLRQSLKRAIILGDPGLGKSWLLKHELIRLVEAAEAELESHGDPRRLTLPIRLALPDVAAVVLAEKEPLVSILRALEQLLPHKLRAVVDLITSAIDQRLVVVLLDSWDETPNNLQGPLKAALNRLPDDLAVIATSRVVGAPRDLWNLAAGTNPARCELELLPFEQTQIEEFVRGFFGAQTHLAESFLAELRQAPQLRGLSEIPLLLGYLCRYVNELSQGGARPNLRDLERTDLYKAILRWYLAADWKENAPPPDEFVLDTDIDLLAGSAYQLLGEGRQRFSRDEFRAALRKSYRSIHDEALSQRDETELLKRFVSAGGVVIPAGSGDRAPLLFAHLTVQEYLTAKHIFDKLDTQVQDQLLGHNWDHPDWQHVWELYAVLGKSKQGHIDRMIETVMDPAHHHELDEHLHRHRAAALRWAGLCEWRHWPNGNAWNNIIAWTKAQFQLDSHERDVCFRVIGSWRRVPVHEVLEPLVRLNTDRAERRQVRTSAFLAWAPHLAAEKSSRDLLELVKNDLGDNRSMAVDAIAAQSWTETIYEFLVTIAFDVNEFRELRLPAIRSLAWMSGRPEIQTRFVEILTNSNEDDDIRLAVVRAIGSRRDVAIAQAYLTGIAADRNNSQRIREAAVQTLAAGAETSPCYNLFLDLARDTNQDAIVRAAAVRALAAHSETEPVRACLLDALQDRNWRICTAAMYALASQSETQSVANFLFRLLSAKDHRICAAAVRVLTKLCITDDLRDRLLDLIADKRDAAVRKAVVTALSTEAGIEQVRLELRKRLNDTDKAVVRAAVFALASQSQTDLVRKSLLLLLNDKQSSSVRRAVINVLTEQSGIDEVNRYFRRSLEASHPSVREAAVIALASESGAEAVRGLLLARINDEDNTVRQAAAKALTAYVLTERHPQLKPS